jgi:hypothetical protein
LTLVSKAFHPFGRLLMTEISKLSSKSFGILGNGAINDTLKQILSHEELKQSFVTQCRTIVDESVMKESDILAIFTNLCTKTFHAWAGEQSQQ